MSTSLHRASILHALQTSFLQKIILRLAKLSYPIKCFEFSEECTNICRSEKFLVNIYFFTDMYSDFPSTANYIDPSSYTRTIWKGFYKCQLSCRPAEGRIITTLETKLESKYCARKVVALKMTQRVVLSSATFLLHQWTGNCNFMSTQLQSCDRSVTLGCTSALQAVVYYHTLNLRWHLKSIWGARSCWITWRGCLILHAGEVWRLSCATFCKRYLSYDSTVSVRGQKTAFKIDICDIWSVSQQHISLNKPGTIYVVGEDYARRSIQTSLESILQISTQLCDCTEFPELVYVHLTQTAWTRW